MTVSALVSCEWLHRNLAAANLVTLDATFFLPRQQRSALDEYRQHHIPGALFFDIDQVADRTNPLPHTLPNTESFAAAVSRMGIDNSTHVMIYDNNHFFAAARVWWMFRVFGHEQVKVLDGGLTRWRQLSFPCHSDIITPATKNFAAQFRPELVYDLAQMQQTQLDGFRQILDSRSIDSFLGQRPLTDPSLKPGHIPGSMNIPYTTLTDHTQQTLLPEQELLALFDAGRVDLSTPSVCSCGSGVSAAVLALALFQAGVTDVPVYDGSWAEWGRQVHTPKQTAE